MTMSVTARELVGCPMTLAQWDALGETEERYELVQGVLTMAASEMYPNRRLSFVLGLMLQGVAGAEVVTDMDVTVIPDVDRPTVRCPDLLVTPANTVGSVGRVEPADLLLVVEVVSPSSRREDWGRKRDEYAAAGIPAYLVVDRLRGEVGLFTRPENGRYAESRVAAAVDVPLLGTTVRVDLRELAPPESSREPDHTV